jgi:hypothetical protein
MEFWAVLYRLGLIFIEAFRWGELTTAKSLGGVEKIIGVFACGAWVVCFWRWAFLVFVLVCWLCPFGCLPAALAFPCFHVGLFVLPLCGAAPTFLCRRKEK